MYKIAKLIFYGERVFLEASAIISMVILIAVPVLILAGFIFYFYRKEHPKAAKARGRQNNQSAVVNPARSFARSNSFRFIAPAKIKGNAAEINLDAVIVGYFGVLGVISLGYNGAVYGSDNDDDWLQVGEDETREYFESPVLEASAGVRAIRDALFAAKLKKVPVEVVYVFADPKVQLAVPRSLNVLKVKNFKALLKKDKYLEDTGLDLDAVENALRNAIIE